MKVAACVLAAGRGRRMGAAKAAIVLYGRTFLEMLLDSLRAARTAPRYVVAAPAPDAAMTNTCAGLGAHLLVNPAPEAGMLSSLHVCLDALAAAAALDAHAAVDALILAPVDCPRVRSGTIAALIAAAAATGAPIVVPSYRGRRGHPTLFAARLFSELRTAPLDAGARAVLHAHASDRYELEVDDPMVLDDFDTPAAVAAAQARERPVDRP